MIGAKTTKHPARIPGVEILEDMRLRYMAAFAGVEMPGRPSINLDNAIFRTIPTLRYGVLCLRVDDSGGFREKSCLQLIITPRSPRQVSSNSSSFFPPRSLRPACSTPGTPRGIRRP
jgi:hypothetical protein